MVIFGDFCILHVHCTNYSDLVSNDWSHHKEQNDTRLTPVHSVIQKLSRFPGQNHSILVSPTMYEPYHIFDLVLEISGNLVSGTEHTF